MDASLNHKNEDFLWAKKKEVHRQFKWLPLRQHLMDTVEIIELLWTHWLSESQKKIIIHSLSSPDEEEARRLIIFLAATHDIAKATPAFQLKRSFFNSKELDEELVDKLSREGFQDLKDLKLNNASSSHHTLAGQVILEKFGVNRDVASIIGAHHGKPVNSQHEIRKQLLAYPENYYQNEKKKDRSHQKWHKVQQEIFNWAVKLAGYNNVNDIPRVQMKGQVILSGLLIMADWISSNEKYYPLFDIEENNTTSQLRTHAAWSEWEVKDTRPMQAVYDIKIKFKDRFKFDPNDMQEKFSTIIKSVQEPGIFILEASMGGGKTEAALFAVEQLSAWLGLNGLFFGLPNQDTSNGIFPRINDWLGNVSQTRSENKGIQLVHGKSHLNQQYNELKNRSMVGDDLEESVLVNEWFSGRKTAMLEDFVVGTVDQFLMMALKSKHLMLRHLGFSRKVVIIDEIHAYDSYMNEYLKMALSWLGNYNIPVVMLSATLPGKTRQELTEAYLRGQGVKSKELQASETWTTTDEYPLVTYSDGNKIKQFTDFILQEDTTVQIFPLKDEELISMLEEKLCEGGVAGIVVNTVKRAQEIALRLSRYFGEEYIELLHSSFIATQRAEKEDNLIATIGKKGDRPFKKIIIGTQVIEQSLDIDFDILITDLAPMDLMIQRIGRLHRHTRYNRPKKLKEPITYILGMNEDYDFDSGAIAVYGEYLLLRSQYFLTNTLQLPSQISTLVQKVYSEEDIHLPENLKEHYLNVKEKYEVLQKKKRQRSRSFMIEKPKNKQTENLIGWLNNVHPNETEERATATVRDTSDSIEVILLKKFNNGYTFLDSDCTINLKDKIKDIEVQLALAKETVRLPNVLSQFYNIDKTIDELEEYRNRYLLEWGESSWLKQALGLILNDQNEIVLNGYRLTYDNKYGLQYEKESDDIGTI